MYSKTPSAPPSYTDATGNSYPQAYPANNNHIQDPNQERLVEFQQVVDRYESKFG